MVQRESSADRDEFDEFDEPMWQPLTSDSPGYTPGRSSYGAGQRGGRFGGRRTEGGGQRGGRRPEGGGPRGGRRPEGGGPRGGRRTEGGGRPGGRRPEGGGQRGGFGGGYGGGRGGARRPHPSSSYAGGDQPRSSGPQFDAPPEFANRDRYEGGGRSGGRRTEGGGRSGGRRTEGGGRSGGRRTEGGGRRTEGGGRRTEGGGRSAPAVRKRATPESKGSVYTSDMYVKSDLSDTKKPTERKIRSRRKPPTDTTGED
jgi:hypothetical protein